MDADRWNRLNAVFNGALERDVTDREAFVREACAGDEALAEEAARLLRAHARAPAALGTAVFAAAVNAISSEDDHQAVGAEVGPYRLIEEIGRGGMGVVYVAERADHQYEKRVAIKLLKRGIDTDAVLRLFRHERQILAGLEHPNITRLLDGGTAADGRPYFVMEYVEGLPIDEYCDRQALSVPDRLQLFREVCAAVSYAHHHLVVHRDLKPSNILVTAAGEPKLLDFGIAKLLDSDADGAVTLFTDSRPMTPEYASPEQLTGRRITTLTDVYSLGLVLYELLAGRRASTPPEHTRRHSSRESRTIDVERPSSVVRRSATTGDGLEVPPEEIAAARRTTPERLRRRLRGDLDTIVLKAIHREPSRRYQSVEALSEDIRRHLAGLPVQGRQDTLLYRGGKFVRRNRAAVMAGTLVVLSLVAGMVATIWQADRARAAQALAERRFDDVRKLANSVLFDYHDAIAALPGATAVRGRLVQDALAYLDGLVTESSDNPGLQRELADAYDKLGDVLGGAHAASLGDTQGALESFRKAQRIREALASAAPGEAQNRRDLAESHRRIGWQLLVTSEAAFGVEHLRRAVSLYRELAAEGVLEYRRGFARASNELGAALEDAGDLIGALDIHRGTVASLEELSRAIPGDPGVRRNLSIAYENTARALFLSGEAAAALDFNAKALEIRAALAAEDPTNADFRRMVAISYQNDGDFRALSGDPDGGLASFRRKLAIDEELLAADPANAQAHHDVAYSSQRLGDILTTLGNRPEALIHYRRSAEELGRMSTATGTDSGLRLALSLAGVARTQARLLNPRAALDAARQAAMAVAKTADDPTNAHQRGIKAQAYTFLAEAHEALASAQEAPPADIRQHWHAACDMFQRSFDIWEDMRRRGILNISDGDKPGEAARELARCQELQEKAEREARGRRLAPAR
jgi:eukaryotic-like serine/threonine-protein kinase